ncbi:MAG: helix-turn-helix transcriptional regulator [Planctomycetes bacterium]|nr:helix-turn-helix transcriptional regulator [Planctomycetota bacterium]
MDEIRSVAEWMARLGMSLETIVSHSALDKRVVQAIVEGHWTPSPAQRQRIASALGVAVEQISWGHKTSVEHLYGHGPQFGRSP